MGNDGAKNVKVTGDDFRALAGNRSMSLRRLAEDLIKRDGGTGALSASISRLLDEASRVDWLAARALDCEVTAYEAAEMWNRLQPTRRTVEDFLPKQSAPQGFIGQSSMAIEACDERGY